MSFRCARRAGVVGPLLRWIGVGAIVACAAAAPRSAFGEPTREDRAAATALFDDGRKLAADKKYAEACPKFEAAMRLDPGIGTLYNLSDCYEQLGRTASAWAGFRDVAAQAKAANQADREKVARDRVTALEPKLSKVRIVMPASFSGGAFTITRDGSSLPSALVGSPVPFDPGAHVLRIEVEGKEPWEKRIDVPAKGGTTDVQVPPFVAKAAASNTASPSGTSTGTVPVETAAPTATLAPTATTAPSSGPVASPRPWQKPLGIGALAAGVVGLGAGVALGFVAKDTYDNSNKSDCDPKTNICNENGLKKRAAAVDTGNIGTIVGIAGGVVGAAGLVLWILAPSAPASPKSGGLTDVRVVAGPASVGVRGRF
ncbi:MAG: hypothetical protein U0441_02500 [Polyangiaceae bacterium]